MEIPNLQEELKRKVMNGMTKLIHDREVGKCTESEYAYALSVLWESIAGLVDRDFFLMSELMAEGLQTAYETQSIFFREKGFVYVIVTNDRKGVVRFKLSAPNAEIKETIYNFEDEPNLYKASKEKVDEITNKLITTGFKEIKG